MYCTSCGARLDGHRFCTRCGAAQGVDTPPAPQAAVPPAAPAAVRDAPWDAPLPAPSSSAGSGAGRVWLAAALVVVLLAASVVAWSQLRDDATVAGPAGGAGTGAEDGTDAGDDAEDGSAVVEPPGGTVASPTPSATDTVEPFPPPAPPPPPPPPAPTAAAGPVPAVLPPTPFYVAIVVSKGAADGGRAAAEAFLAPVRAAGYEPVLFESSAYDHLNAGYWVAAAGTWSTLAPARDAAAALQRQGIPGATTVYPRCIGTRSQCAGSGA